MEIKIQKKEKPLKQVKKNINRLKKRIAHPFAFDSGNKD